MRDLRTRGTVTMDRFKNARNTAWDCNPPTVRLTSGLAAVLMAGMLIPTAVAQGVTAETDARVGAKRQMAPFAVPEGFAVRALQSQRPDFDPLSPSAGGAEVVPSGSVDSDQDGLTDAEEAQLGTDPLNPDTDGDGLLDGWEVHKVNGVDLRALGASPLRKDVFVQMDFMIRRTGNTVVDFRPTDDEKRRIREAFAAAPVSNPDGTTGITIHLIDGNEVPHDADLNPVEAEFFDLKRRHFDQNRAPLFHYMIWADGYNGGTSSGRSMGIPSSDFIVTLGRWATPGGTPDQKVGTFIHEIGHNFGLRHGGSDDIGHKPNHLSVMNYSFQTRGVPFRTEKRFDYQRFALPSLDETKLDENFGLGRSPSLLGYRTLFSSPSGVFTEAPAHASVDWNVDSTINNTPVVADINDNNQNSILPATPNEWGQFIYNGGSIGSSLSLSGALAIARAAFAPLPSPELTFEKFQKIEADLARK
jgi:hypothetical protein